MVSTKYAKDYRMDTEKDENGRVKTKMVYVGAYYLWSIEREQLKRLRSCSLLCLVAEWLLFLGSMCFYSAISRNWYVILPYACLIIVLLFKSMAVFNLYVVKEPMNRERKDKTTERFSGASLCGMALGAAAAVGEMVVWIRTAKLLQMADYVFVAATVCLFLLMLCSFHISRQLQVREQENPVAAEWKNK